MATANSISTESSNNKKTTDLANAFTNQLLSSRNGFLKLFCRDFSHEFFVKSFSQVFFLKRFCNGFFLVKLSIYQYSVFTLKYP